MTAILDHGDVNGGAYQEVLCFERTRDFIAQGIRHQSRRRQGLLQQRQVQVSPVIYPERL
jgi:hypothetical protein